MRPKHSHLLFASKNSVLIARYLQNIFIPLPIIFFYLNSDIDYPAGILKHAIDSDINVSEGAIFICYC
jgi:hypothetical protein